MAVISPAIGVQSGSHSAKAFRQLLAAVSGHDPATFVNGVSATGPAHGLCSPNALNVTQNGTPNMSVNVAKGTALITGSSSLAQGAYAFTNDATVNLAIATADATNPRRDLVIAQVRDNTEDSSGFNDARLFVVTGTPAASPVDPVVPANCLVIARVQVAAGVTSIVNANITTLAQRITSLASPQFEDGTYTPTLTNMAIGAGGSPSNAARWQFFGGRNVGDEGLLFLEGEIVLGTSGSVSGAVSIGVPSGFQFVSTYNPRMYTARSTAGGGNFILNLVIASATTIAVNALRANATYLDTLSMSATIPGTWAAGNLLNWGGLWPAVRV